MNITVQYAAQLRQITGASSESITMSPGATVHELLHDLVDRYHERLGPLLLTADRRPQTSILVFVNDQQIRMNEASPLQTGDRVTLLSPIAGG